MPIKDAAVVAAATYANRYLTERKLPDKAIDLLDEACSRLRMQQESKPDAIATLDRDIVTLRIEMEALKKERDPASVARIATLKQTLQNKQHEIDTLSAHWQAERARRKKVATSKTKLDALRVEMDQALRAGNYTRAGQLQYMEIPQLEAELKDTGQRPEGDDETEASSSEDSVARALMVVHSNSAQTFVHFNCLVLLEQANSGVSYF